MTLPAGVEHGDRHAFLARASTLGARTVEPNIAHPLPASPWDRDEFVPITYTTVDPKALADSYEQMATSVLLDVRRFDRIVPDDALRVLIESEEIRSAVVSKMAGAQRLGERLLEFGVEVFDYSPERAVQADLGITEPRFAIAATGSLVQDSSLEGGRGASLIPRIHLALVPEHRIVVDTAAVFAHFRTEPMPANVVLISAPSRTGDIEMILTVGVHGPIKVIVALLSS